MAFKTNFKDEIVSNGRTRQIVDANTGGVIHDKVQIKNNYIPDQVGDKLGADWINAVGQRLNNLESGIEKVSKATNADNATNATKANDADKISRLGLDGKHLPISTDCLGISLDGSYNGRLEQIDMVNYPNTKNYPVEKFIGTKQQLVMGTGWGIVILHEMHPVAGRIWMNAYNQQWRGWQGFSDDTSVINAAVAQAVEYLNVHGMNMGSASNPNRPINFFSNDGTYYQLHSNGGAFWIHKFNASNQVIAVSLTIDGNGISTVNNAQALNGMKIYTTYYIINPAGSDTVYVPMPSMSRFCTGLAVNGNFDVNDAYVIGCKGNGNTLKVKLNKATSLPIQINTMIVYE